jgi:hypothetical protein
MNDTARIPPDPQPTQQIAISDIIGIYVAISSIPTPTTETRTKILAKLENVILHFTNGFQTP